MVEIYTFLAVLWPTVPYRVRQWNNYAYNAINNLEYLQDKAYLRVSQYVPLKYDIQVQE